MYCTSIVTLDNQSQPGACRAVFFLISVVNVVSMLPNYQYLFLSCNPDPFILFIPDNCKFEHSINLSIFGNNSCQVMHIHLFHGNHCPLFSHNCNSRKHPISCIDNFSTCTNQLMCMIILVTIPTF